MDSIHAVESSDPHVENIEDSNDSEENEVLMKFFKTYDNSLYEIKKNDNEQPIVNTRRSLRFIPSSLKFPDQPINIPEKQTVIIINDNSESIELNSLMAKTNEFYALFFKETVLEPYGGNTSINIYYLPRSMGIKQTMFIIDTNRGKFYYNVSGIGKANPFRLRPLIDATVPLNSTYEYIIEFYNPHSYALEINEIYTSDENLIIGFLSTKNIKNRIAKQFEYHEQWYLKPYEIKAIIKINYFAYKLNKQHGYVCIKTNFSDIIIIPVEINVSNKPGLYSNVDLLEFIAAKYLHSFAKSITIPVYAFNNGLNTMLITDIRVTQKHKDYITVSCTNLPIPPNTHHLQQIADITIHPNLVPVNINHINGYVQVYTSSNNEDPALEIPFDEIIYHGSLEYQKEDTYFYIPSLNYELNNEKRSKCRPIKILNQFSLPISVYNITLNSLEQISQYIKIEYRSSFIHLYPNQSNELLCITILEKSLSSKPFTNIQGIIDLQTNLTNFIIPIYLYNGFLSVSLVNDVRNGGIKRDEKDPFAFWLTSIPVNTSHTVTFILTNPNPISIRVKNFNYTFKNASIKLDNMIELNANERKKRFRNSNENTKISQFMILENHQAIFSLTIQGDNLPQIHNESIIFETDYQILKLNINYEIVNGSLEFINKTPIHFDVFPTHIGSVDVFLQNKFDKPIHVLRMDFMAYEVCFSFIWNNISHNPVELQQNKIQEIGKLNFDMTPLCENSSMPSESTYYCSLSHKLNFKQQWNKHISTLNTYELDYMLVTKFRNLWNKWATLVQRQKIQTNIWLYTDRVNISWAVSIGFVWPSVLENMSSSLARVPIILNFHLTLINSTQAQNIIISNPSTYLVTYSVQLLNNYSNDSKLNMSHQIFTITTTSTRISLMNGIYNFNLSSNDQIIFTVSYQPTSLIKHEMFLVIRNNLTIIESILLCGEGGTGELQVGSRTLGSSLIPIILNVDEKHYEVCLNENVNPSLGKFIQLHNRGNLKTVIYNISFGHLTCFGHGFSVPICTNIEIEPNEKYDLNILFQPDYTSIEINETLILNTNIGLMIFPIIVRIPQLVLITCYEMIPRPPWELRTFGLCFCSFIVFIVLIFAAAVYEARRLFDNYLTRAEWRDRIQTTNNRIFDLSDLSLAVQDEQKARERIESNSTKDTKNVQIIEIFKNDTKLKHSVRLNNDNEEKPVKTIQSSIISDSAVQSTSTSSKEIAHKSRRATTDSGPSKSLYVQQDTLLKKSSVTRRKSEQHKSSTPSKNVSSTTVSEEENEPFVIPRSRRTSNKTKEISNNIVAQSTSDKIVCSTIQKSSFHSNLLDQPQDRSQLDKCSNQEQSRKVNSNKVKRSGAMVRRGTTDETQETSKVFKSTSNSSESSVILPPISRTDSFISYESTHGYDHRLRHNSASIMSATSIPKAIEKRDSQVETSVVATSTELTSLQLTEHLSKDGLVPSESALSMSISLKSSSIPSFSYGSNDDDIKINNSDDNEKEESIDWDEPTVPDEDFAAYAQESEYRMDEINDINQHGQTQQSLTADKIPSLTSQSITPPVVTKYIHEHPTITTVVKENIEPLPFPQNRPGPIQRPPKLKYSLIAPLSSFLTHANQSPSTPDVLVEINHLLDHQNSVTTSTANVTNPISATAIPNDISALNIPWTPLSPPEWPSKYDSSWSTTSIQSPTNSLRQQVPNQFLQAQISSDESSVWSSALGTTRPSLESSNTYTQQASSKWNEIFSSADSSSNSTTEPTNNSWLKFLPISESSSVDSTTINRQENEINNPLWNLINSGETQQNSATSWWPKISSEDNNDSDKSRWDFAR